MKHMIKRLTLLTSLACAGFLLQAQSFKPTVLQTDLLEHTERTWQNGYLTNLNVWQMDESVEPLQFAAIRSEKPAFSWIVPGNVQNTKQTAYRIIVSDQFQEANSEKDNLWDSGWVDSEQSVAVRYDGSPLQPNSTYFWQVKIRTNTTGESDWSEVKAFRTADIMSKYATGFYPQVKTQESPLLIKPLTAGQQFVDFGKDAFGQLLITLNSAAALSDTVVIHLGECLENDRILRNTGASTIRYHRYPLAIMEGTHTYRIKIKKDKRNTSGAALLMPGYIGEVVPFRYCEIEGYQSHISQADIKREAVHYPFNEQASSFLSDNQILNQIWDLCKYSIKATSFLGVYVDGDRERIPYEADALINQLSHYGVDREYAMARHSYEYLLDAPTWPTEWILQAIMMAWNDYLYTGDSRSLESNYELLKPRVLMSLREKNGLISTTTGLQTPEFISSIRMSRSISDIVDWPHTKFGNDNGVMGESDFFEFTDYNAVTNAYHYEVLKEMAQIASVLGSDEDARSYKKEAEQFKKRYIDAFYRSDKGIFADGLKADTDHAALHSNMFPLAFGLAPSGKSDNILDFIRSRGMACSVYGSQFLMDAIYEAEDADYGLSLLTKTDDRSWYNMIRVGSTISLEAWDNKYKPNQDWNHAWGAAPANIIPRKLLGVEPLLPGFEKARIKPQIGSLAYVKAKVPTVRGAIEMQIDQTSVKYQLQVIIPGNMQAEIYLPKPNRKNFKINCNGKLLKPVELKNSSFLSVGTFGSGVYTIIIQ